VQRCFGRAAEAIPEAPAVSRDRGEHDEMTAMLCCESSRRATGSWAFIPPNHQAQPFRASIPPGVVFLPTLNRIGLESA
jgi:hypothetical protein